MLNLIGRANEYSCLAHDSIDQIRKYTFEPYWYHTQQVAYLVSLVSLDEATIAAAHLHDVIEDVVPRNEAYTVEGMRQAFGDKVVDLVLELTDISKLSDGNRETRKKIDREHYINASTDAQTIKLADLIDNTRSIVEYDPVFAKIYLAEKALLLPYLKQGDLNLYKLAESMLCLSYKKLGAK